MDMVQDSKTPEGRAYDVEQCQCGKEYTGLSCEVLFSFGTLICVAEQK